MSLANIRFVLVKPTHPGNVGAAARALKTMALDRLYLVAPSRYPSPEAQALAAGAEDVLQAARICDTLEEAIADCRWVVGTSARSRHIEWPVAEARAGAERVVQAAALGPVAVVFGQERSGLTNDELDRCHMLVQIPANPAYPSLNLASAVQILAYEIRVAALAGVPPATNARRLATRAEMHRFYRHLAQVLIGTGFLDPNNPRLLMRRLMRLFNRAEPDDNDINILRGVLTSVERAAALDKNRPDDPN